MNGEGLRGAVARRVLRRDLDRIGVGACRTARRLEVRRDFEAQRAGGGVKVEQRIVRAAGQRVSGDAHVVAGLRREEGKGAAFSHRALRGEARCKHRRGVVHIGDLDGHVLRGAVAGAVIGGNGDSVAVAALRAGGGFEVGRDLETKLAAAGVELEQGNIGAANQRVGAHRDVVAGLCRVHDAMLTLKPVDRDLGLSEHRRLFVHIGDLDAQALCGAVARGIHGSDLHAVAVAAVGAARAFEVGGRFEAQRATLVVEVKQRIVHASREGVGGDAHVVARPRGVEDVATSLGHEARDAGTALENWR